MPINLDSFTLPANVVNRDVPISQAVEPAMASDGRPEAPAYRVQPMVWTFVVLGLAIVGLYFFLEG